METMQIEISRLKPNPFKKFINKGELEEDIIERLVEGFKQTKFHDNLTARKNKHGEIELIYGHHRLEAVKRVYGSHYKIHIKVYDYNEFSDEKMLIDMIRENLTHRGDSYKDTADSILLVKKWLEDKAKNEAKTTRKTARQVTNGDIARFLSTQEKAINRDQVLKFMNIENGLLPELKSKLTKKIKAGIKPGKGKDKDILGFEIASVLASTIEKKDQKAIYEQMKNGNLNRYGLQSALYEYKKASKDIKDKVKGGEVKLDEIVIENIKSEIKRKSEEAIDCKDKKVVVIQYKKFLREVGNKVGDTNTKIFQTCAYLDGLQQSGVLSELDWNKLHDILELAVEQGKRYTKFAEKMLEKL